MSFNPVNSEIIEYSPNISINEANAFCSGLKKKNPDEYFENLGYSFSQHTGLSHEPEILLKSNKQKPHVILRNYSIHDLNGNSKRWKRLQDKGELTEGEVICQYPIRKTIDDRLAKIFELEVELDLNDGRLSILKENVPLFNKQKISQNLHSKHKSIKIAIKNIVSLPLVLFALPEGVIFEGASLLSSNHLYLEGLELIELFLSKSYLGLGLKGLHGYEAYEHIHEGIKIHEDESSSKEQNQLLEITPESSSKKSSKENSQIQTGKASSIKKDEQTISQKEAEDSKPLNLNAPLTIDEIKKEVEIDKKELKTLKIVYERTKESKESLLKNWMQLWQNGSLNHIANYLSILFYQHAQNKLRKEERNKIAKDHSKEVHKMNAKIAPGFTTLPDLIRTTGQSLNPMYWSLSERLDESEKLIKEYQESHKHLLEQLETRSALEKEINVNKVELEKLDNEIKNHFNEVLSKREKSANFLHNIEATINIAGGFLSSAGLSTAGSVTGIAAGSQEKRGMKANSQFQQSLNTSLGTHNLIHQIEQSNESQKQQIQNGLLNQYLYLLTLSKFAVPSEYREALDINLKEINEKISKLEKNIADDQKQLIYNQQYQQNLSNNISQLENSHNLEHHPKRQKQLYDQKQQLIESNAQSLNLKLKIETEKDELFNTKKIKEKYEAEIISQEHIGKLQDLFYEEIKKEIESQHTSDSNTRKYRQALNEGFNTFSMAQFPRWNAMVNGFASFEILLKEFSELASFWEAKDLAKIAQKGQATFSIIKQIYNCFELFKTFNLGNQVLKTTLETLLKTNPDATIFDAIKYIGVTTFVGNYLVPGTQIISTGLLILKMSSHLYYNNQSSPPIEKQLATHLQNISKHLYEQFKFLHAKLGSNHVEVLNYLTQLSEKTTLFHLESTNQIKLLQKKLEKKLDNNQRIQQTLEIIKKGEKIQLQSNEALEEISNAKTIDEKKQNFEIYLKKIKFWLEKTILYPSNNGLILERLPLTGKKGYQPTIQISDALIHPEIYSGLAGKVSHFEGEVPSLYLVSIIAKEYRKLKKQHADLFNPVDSSFHANVLNDIHELFIASYKQIEQLTKHIHSYADELRKDQDQILDFWKEQIKFGRSQQVDYSFPSSIESSNFSCSGGERFNIREILCQKQLYNASEKKYEYVKQGTVLGTVANATAAAIVGVVAHPALPFLVGGALASQVLVTTGCGIIDRQKNIVEEYKKLFFNASTLTTFEDKAKLHLVADSEIEIFIDENGQFKITFEKVKMLQKKLKHTIYPFHAIGDIRFFNKPQIKTEKDSIIQYDELQKLKNIPLMDSSLYSKQIKKLMKDYKQWLELITEKANLQKSFKTLQKTNPFVDLAKEGVLLQSNNHDFLPLLFPKKLIEACEKSVLRENKLFALEKNALIPNYDLSHIQGEGYSLKLQYCQNNTSLIEIQIAFIDEATVHSFSQASFHTDFPPQLNEFLLQAMYTNHMSHYTNNNLLGMPGFQTTLLNKGNWKVPVELPFPGFFNLWNIETGQILFNHRFYTPEKSNQLMEKKTSLCEAPLFPFITPLGQKKLQDIKNTLDEKFSHLKEKYSTLKLLSCLSTSLDDTSLKHALNASFGIIECLNGEMLLEAESQELFCKAPEKEFFDLLTNLLPNEDFIKLKKLISDIV